MAMLFGALLILGISPGPQLVDEHPDVFWGVINSMYIGNILLLILIDSAGGLVRPDPAGAPGDPGAHHRADHDPGCLHDQQLGVRHLRDAGLRHRRLPDEEGRLRPRPDGAGVRAGLHHRVEHPPVAARSSTAIRRASSPGRSRARSSAHLRVVLLRPLLPVVKRASTAAHWAHARGAREPHRRPRRGADGCCRGGRAWRRGR